MAAPNDLLSMYQTQANHTGQQQLSPQSLEQAYRLHAMLSPQQMQQYRNADQQLVRGQFGTGANKSQFTPFKPGTDAYNQNDFYDGVISGPRHTSMLAKMAPGIAMAAISAMAGGAIPLPGVTPIGEGLSEAAGIGSGGIPGMSELGTVAKGFKTANSLKGIYDMIGKLGGSSSGGAASAGMSQSNMIRNLIMSRLSGMKKGT